MKYFLAIVISASVGYLLGSCNFAIIVVNIVKEQDIRTMGSKNAGLTNTLRCCGAGCALITLIGDVCKGVFAVGISRLMCQILNAGLSPENDSNYVGYIAGIFAVIGHVFPIYFDFRGGKGVLVAVASFLMVDTKVFGISLLIFIITLALSHYVSVSSITAAAFCPIVTFMMSFFMNGNSFGRSLFYMSLALVMSSIIIFMHRSNIERLKNGTENKLILKKSEKK